jgi:cytosine/adenosine deaminase-related metal-dependent hydrolase
MFGWAAAVTFVNARVMAAEGEARSVRFGKRILDLDGEPHSGDAVIDLGGRFVLPGLVNAHDHLELNHYGLLKRRAKYDNAAEWIADLEPVIRRDPDIVARSRVSLADRLFAGGLKNLLGGVTTVAHHNPVYGAFGRHFPVAILKRFGWAHSLGLEEGPAGAQGEPGGSVAERYAATPVDQPFIVHAAEGTDSAAADEIDALESRACLGANTVLVHGVAVTPERWATLFGRGVSLAWCPASNLFLFGETAPMSAVLAQPGARGRVCLGTDSRLTGSRDLLDEMRVAAMTGATAADLLPMVTTTPADVLRLPAAGRIRVGSPADIIVVPVNGDDPATSLLRCARSELKLVVRGGRPLIGAPHFSAVFTARGMAVRHLEVDTCARIVEATLASRIERCAIREPGVEVI